MITPVNYAMPVREFSSKLNTPKWEAAKVVGRWILFFIAASIFTDLLRQIDLMPEALCTKVPTGLMCFTVRENVRILITLALGYLENYTHRANKQDSIPSGFIPF